MKFTNLALSLAIGTTMIQPGSASIGRAAGLACDLFCDGIASLFVEIFGKRSIPVKGGALDMARRQNTPGVPQFEYERCYNELQSSGGVLATSPAQFAVQFTNVPPTCMNLANVLVGDPAEGPYALPCGSDCLRYDDLTQGQYDDLVAALRAVAD